LTFDSGIETNTIGGGLLECWKNKVAQKEHIIYFVVHTQMIDQKDIDSVFIKYVKEYQGVYTRVQPLDRFSSPCRYQW